MDSEAETHQRQQKHKVKQTKMGSLEHLKMNKKKKSKKENGK